MQLNEVRAIPVNADNLEKGNIDVLSIQNTPTLV